MIPRGPSRIFFAILLLLAMSMPAFAQKTIDELCRTHGLGGDNIIRRIETSYVAAVQAGISEEVLLLFVEDILRAKFDCGQMVRVLDVTTRLRQADLPYFVVFSKVREGVAKEAPPARVVEAAEAKFTALSESRDVLLSLGSMGYSIRDRQNAAVIVSSYIEKGYSSGEIVSQIRKKGIQGAGFAALSGIVEKPVKRKVH
ncbi:MAG: hypothetical protein WC899_03570 [bacterium]|jgi:hypothetical protein